MPVGSELLISLDLDLTAPADLGVVGPGSVVNEPVDAPDAAEWQTPAKTKLRAPANAMRRHESVCTPAVAIVESPTICNRGNGCCVGK